MSSAKAWMIFHYYKWSEKNLRFQKTLGWYLCQRENIFIYNEKWPPLFGSVLAAYLFLNSNTPETLEKSIMHLYVLVHHCHREKSKSCYQNFWLFKQQADVGNGMYPFAHTFANTPDLSALLLSLSKTLNLEFMSISEATKRDKLKASFHEVAAS